MIALLGAMDVEIEGFMAHLVRTEHLNWNGLDFHLGTLDGHRVLVSKSGVGKVMASLVTQHIIDRWHPRALLFTGIAGSLRAEVGIGDTLLGRDLVQHDLEASSLGVPRGQIPFSGLRFMTAHPMLLRVARNFAPREGRLHEGRICTGDQFITHRELDSHRYLVEELEGAGVEMEGAAVALVCHLNRIPSLVVRTISDMADGSAAVNFEAFLPRAGINSLDFVRHMLRHMPPGSLDDTTPPG